MSESNNFSPQGYDNTNHFWNEGEEVVPEIDENEYHMNPQGYDNTAHFWGGGDTPQIAATIEVDNVQTFTLDPDRDAEAGVRNVGTEQEAKLAFTFGIPKGDKGDTGAQGPTGPQGIQGLKGDKGEQGLQGEKGEKGDKGERGPQGPIGETGPAGPEGPEGPQGPKGDTGLTGPQGPQGIQGEKGDTGDTGPQGPAGATGAQGPTGPEGPQGPAGSDGTDGITPVISATASVGTGTGSPSCTVTKTGTDEAPSFAFAFDGIKGADAQGSEGFTGVDTIYSGTWKPFTSNGISVFHATLSDNFKKNYKFFKLNLNAGCVYFPAKKSTDGDFTIPSTYGDFPTCVLYNAQRYAIANAFVEMSYSNNTLLLTINVNARLISGSEQTTNKSYSLMGFY